MAHFAKLVIGETYHVQNVLFVKGKAVEVDETLARYLTSNSQFEVVLDESEQDDGGSNEDDDDEQDDEEKDEDEQDEEPVNRESLIAEALALGLSFGKRTSTKNLQKLVEEAKAEKGEE